MDLSSPPPHPPSSPPSRPLRRAPSYTATPAEAAAPMTIPGADLGRAAPPPPLPPPANVEELGLTHDHSWTTFNNPNWQGFNSLGRPDLNISRARLGSYMDPRDTDAIRRGSTFTVVPGNHSAGSDTQRSRTPSDGGNGSALSPSYKLQSERQLEKSSVDTSSQQYDRNLLSKIGGPNTPLRMPSFSSTTSGDVPSVSPNQTDSRGPAFQRLSIPERRRSSNDSRFSRNNSSTGIFTPTSFRSNSIFLDPQESGRTLKRHPSLMFDDPPSYRNSYDSNMITSPMEEGPMRDLCLSDRSPGGKVDDYEARAGMKRRASSPRGELMRSERSSVSSVPGHLEGARRSIHQLPPRSSPATKYRHPMHSSISSASSMGNRTASMASSRLSIASSITSLGSGHLTPNTLPLLSASLDPELSPYPTSKSLNPSPRSSVCPPQFTRHSMDSSARQSLTPTASSELYPHSAGGHGILICDCCPKKPKKFSTEEDLRLHHMEKQYTCLYCPNRFKNKNEAERHQNSLHLRQHSWSCASLPSVEAAFHPQPDRQTDICGYCGDEFRNPADWAARRAHLGVVHKFGECNQMKKFFRADHFRQHLKHSHAGTSGKWTNILENACMRDEPPPQPMQRGPPVIDYTPAIHHPQQPVGAGGPLAVKPETIEERAEQ